MASRNATKTSGGGPADYADYAGVWAEADLVGELGVWRWDVAEARIELSAGLARLCGRDRAMTISEEDFIGGLHVDDRERVREEMRSAMAQARPFAWQARFLGSNGEARTVASSGSCADAAGDAMAEVIGICSDVSSQATVQSRLGQLERRLADIITHSPSMIAIMDLERRLEIISQDVADLVGRPLGELVGKTATEVLPAHIGAAVDAQVAEAISSARTTHGDLELELHGQLRTFHLISFALTDHAGAPVEVCAIATDVTDSRHRAEQTRLRRETTELVTRALAEDRIVVAAQPVHDITGAQVVSAELLVRLALPNGTGLLQPTAFLPLAEQFDLIQGIDTWMVQRALEIAAAGGLIQVNLSAVTFSDPGARETILAGLQRDLPAAANIVFEVTETAAAHHLDAAVQFAAALTELGCGLALDDFGTGFGSFTYLRRLPLRYLKIDRSFVTGLPHSRDDRRVVSSIIGIARQFELLTIAEGVEDARTLNILGELGADFAQGFHLGRPEPI